MNIIANADNKSIIEVTDYEALEPEIKKQVDLVASELESMSYNELISYGWDIQAAKNEMVNKGVLATQDFDYGKVHETLDHVLNAKRFVMPREKTLFRKAYVPSAQEKRQFVGVVGILEDAIKTQISEIQDQNKLYLEIAMESKKIGDQYAILIMAITKYLSNTQNTQLINLLNEKKFDFAESRVEHLNSMLEYIALCYTNGLVINKFYKIINHDLHKLQEQLLIQTGINEIKTVLGTCDSIKDSISELTRNNLEELKATNERLSDHNAAEIKKLDLHNWEEGIKLLSKNSTILDNEEIEKEEFNEYTEGLNKKRVELVRVLRQLNGLDSVPEYQLFSKDFFIVDEKIVQKVKEWYLKNPNVLSPSMNIYLRRAIRNFSSPYQISYNAPKIEDLSTKITFCPDKKSGCYKSGEFWKSRVASFAPSWESDIATVDEFLIFYVYGIYCENIKSDYKSLRMILRDGYSFVHTFEDTIIGYNSPLLSAVAVVLHEMPVIENNVYR